MNPLTQSKNATILPVLIALVLACFAVSPPVQAVVPAPDGGYPNGNTAEGDNALFNLDTSQGLNNTALGSQALFSDTTGFQNTATGAFALFSNTTGLSNTAIGYVALEFNTIGTGNTGIGIGALSSNTTGNDNTAIGSAALIGNTTGNDNAAIGSFALFLNRTGSSNIALGNEAGFNLRTGSNNIYIGNFGGGGHESAKIRIGTTGTQTATFIAGISGVTVPAGVGVIVGTDGKLGTVVSSERFKDGITPMEKASEAILALKPVTFRYKHDLDPDCIPQFGLVAEEVEKVNPDLVARDKDGKPYSVRYEAVNAMLLNEFLKEHRKVQELEAALTAVNERLKAQDAKIDKVNAKVELTKPAPQMVVNDQ